MIGALVIPARLTVFPQEGSQCSKWSLNTGRYCIWTLHSSCFCVEAVTMLNTDAGLILNSPEKAGGGNRILLAWWALMIRCTLGLYSVDLTINVVTKNC